MSIAIFAGSFDPFTAGHLDIVQRAAPRFDKLYVSISRNPGKDRSRFTLEERLELIRDAVSGIENIEVTHFEGLLVDYCHEIGANSLIRSIRNGTDLDYERQLETVNRQLDPELETVFLLSKPELAYISSTLVRQLMDLGISIAELVPNANHTIILNKLNGGNQ